MRSVQKVSDFFSRSNSVQANHLFKAWVHTHAIMRNREKFQADWFSHSYWFSHSFSAKYLWRWSHMCLVIFYFRKILLVWWSRGIASNFFKNLAMLNWKQFERSSVIWRCGLKPCPDKPMV